MNLLFVCMSDLHLGEEDSLLTNLSLGEPLANPQAPGPCMLALVNYLHALKRGLNAEKPIPFLILNGDIIELAVSSFPLAVTYFRLFLTEVAKRKLFDKVVFIPGNHDHILWSLIRDTLFIRSMSEQQELSKHPVVQHVTQLSVPRVSPVLNLIGSNLPMQISSPTLLAANPAFRLRSWDGIDFLFHHGHLLEDLYKMLSMLRERILNDVPMEDLRKKALGNDLAEIEVENWPWIDFIWSSFARAGRVGKIAEDIYELMSKPQGVKTLVHRIAEVVRTDFEIPFVPEKLEDNLIRFILTKALEKEGVGSEERADPNKPPFNHDLKTMAHLFIRHYLKKELADEGFWPAKNRSCFLFGHTHKPFTDALLDEQAGFGEISVLNSGGWVVESEKYRENYGPGIILGCNDGSTALITYRLDIKTGADIKTKGLWDESFKTLREHEELQTAVSEAVKVRRRYFRKRIRRTEKVLKNLRI